jgi:hypothetical protein
MGEVMRRVAKPEGQFNIALAVTLLWDQDQEYD